MQNAATPMSDDADRIWDLIMQGSDELADEMGLEAPPSPFSPERALGAVDGWLAHHREALDEEDAGRLGMLLARVLIENHGGGVVRIAERGHPLEGEWAVSGFTRGLDGDYHVPFVVSAVRIGIDRSLTAAEWYRQVIAEGRR
jgi:hypothetical protein